MKNQKVDFNKLNAPGFQRVTITPDYAKELLEGNKNNRTPRMRHVEFLSKEMKSGNWQFNGETIKVSNGTLLDGQHRLMACVMSGVPFETIVVYNLQESTFSTIDTGKSRAARDVLKVNGMKSVSILAGAVRYVHAYFSGHSTITNSKLSNTDTLEVIDEHELLQDFASWSDNNKAKFSGMASPSVVAAMFYLFSLSNSQKAEMFFDELVSGFSPNRDSAALALRNLLIRNGLSKAKIGARDTVPYFISAFNRYLKGKSCSRIVAKKGEQIIGLPVSSGGVK